MCPQVVVRSFVPFEESEILVVALRGEHGHYRT